MYAFLSNIYTVNFFKKSRCTNYKIAKYAERSLYFSSILNLRNKHRINSSSNLDSFFNVYDLL